MVYDFFYGVGSGLLLVLVVALGILFVLWLGQPILVWRLVQSNRVLLEEVRSLRHRLEKAKESEETDPER